MRLTHSLSLSQWVSLCEWQFGWIIIKCGSRKCAMRCILDIVLWRWIVSYFLSVDRQWLVPSTFTSFFCFCRKYNDTVFVTLLICSFLSMPTIECWILCICWLFFNVARRRSWRNQEMFSLFWMEFAPLFYLSLSTANGEIICWINTILSTFLKCTLQKQVSELRKCSESEWLFDAYETWNFEFLLKSEHVENLKILKILIHFLALSIMSTDFK